MSKKVVKKDKKVKLMTEKQRVWLKEYLETGNATQSSMKAYDCDYMSAMSIGYQNKKILLEDNFNIVNWLEKAGITDKKIAEKINYLLDHDNYKAIDAGIEKVLKIKGIGVSRTDDGSKVQNNIFIAVQEDRERFIK